MLDLIYDFTSYCALSCDTGAS